MFYENNKWSDVKNDIKPLSICQYIIVKSFFIMFYVDKNCTKAESSYFTQGVSSNNDDSLPSRNCIGNTCHDPNSTDSTYERNCIIKTNGKIFII